MSTKNENRKITFDSWEAAQRIFGGHNNTESSFLKRNHFRKGTTENTTENGKKKNYRSFGESKEIKF